MKAVQGQKLPSHKERCRESLFYGIGEKRIFPHFSRNQKFVYFLYRHKQGLSAEFIV